MLSLEGVEQRGLFKPSVIIVHLELVSIGTELSVLPPCDILLSRILGKSPLVTLEEFLASSKFELSTAEGLDHVGLVVVLGPDTDQDLANGNTGGNTDGLSIRVTHTGTETISTGARKHLVGTEDHEGVGPHADVVRLLSNGLSQMLVDGNTGCLKGLGRNLLLLVAHHVRDKGEQIDGSLLGSYIVNADLGVGHTTAVPTLDVGFVLLVAVASGRTATHVFYMFLGRGGGGGMGVSEDYNLNEGIWDDWSWRRSSFGAGGWGMG